ncbi:hypothetical protein MPTK1_3g16980 [Marchantia polymorpha subsp. ruderalis]|uniref:Uncharacterized protein n=2 Tax=Marchantia polymorpha TaxID=3197 RepID=A0AAF6B1N1_MARPO|nr:hypothetical protein MARPO_0039s0097 [Marchantia polymorpha]BBN05915.1 hypothetical protein Mp_3g16980 [Marchantia polymorpha subsp. ruderalis]|eukprot:PTQ40610.1 hypothetical protein MARPO_0039s0097 [Marchantia polymorpha]
MDVGHGTEFAETDSCMLQILFTSSSLRRTGTIECQHLPRPSEVEERQRVREMAVAAAIGNINASTKSSMQTEPMCHRHQSQWREGRRGEEPEPWPCILSLVALCTLQEIGE